MVCDSVAIGFPWEQQDNTEKLRYWNEGYRYMDASHVLITKTLTTDCVNYVAIPDPTQTGISPIVLIGGLALLFVLYYVSTAVKYKVHGSAAKWAGQRYIAT